MSESSQETPVAAAGVSSSSGSGQQPPPPPPSRRPEPHTIGGIKAPPPIKRRQCNCKRSNCLKLYCECFANGLHCDEYRCNCLSCHNNVANERVRRGAIEAILDRNPNAFRPKIVAAGSSSPTSASTQGATRHHKGCHCKRSNCLKKYCECFQATIYCTDRCRCQECKNYEGCETRERIVSALQAAAAANVSKSNDGSSPRGTPLKKPRLDPMVFADTGSGRAPPRVRSPGPDGEPLPRPSPLLDLLNGSMVEDLIGRLLNAALVEQRKHSGKGTELVDAGLQCEFLGGGGGGGGGTIDNAMPLPDLMPVSAPQPPPPPPPSEGQDKGDELLAADEELGLTTTQQPERRVTSLYQDQETAVLQHLGAELRQLAELASKPVTASLKSMT